MARSRAVVVAILAAASVGGWWLGQARAAASRPVLVLRALDGDTVEVRLAGGGTDTVRLLGVDTPETHHPRKPVECFGPEAARYTRRALRAAGRPSRRRRAPDRYGRRLSYVHHGGEALQRRAAAHGLRALPRDRPTAPTPRPARRGAGGAPRRRGPWGAAADVVPAARGAAGGPTGESGPDLVDRPARTSTTRAGVRPSRGERLHRGRRASNPTAARTVSFLAVRSP